MPPPSVPVYAYNYTPKKITMADQKQTMCALYVNCLKCSVRQDRLEFEEEGRKPEALDYEFSKRRSSVNRGISMVSRPNGREIVPLPLLSPISKGL
jgi:hypothetical protein